MPEEGKPSEVAPQGGEEAAQAAPAPTLEQLQAERDALRAEMTATKKELEGHRKRITLQSKEPPWAAALRQRVEATQAQVVALAKVSLSDEGDSERPLTKAERYQAELKGGQERQPAETQVTLTQRAWLHPMRLLAKKAGVDVKALPPELQEAAESGDALWQGGDVEGAQELFSDALDQYQKGQAELAEATRKKDQESRAAAGRRLVSDSAVAQGKANTWEQVRLKVAEGTATPQEWKDYMHMRSERGV